MNVKKSANETIITNKKARFEYFIEEQFESGMVLEGWEVKSLRAGRVNLSDAYVIVRRNEAWIIGMDIQPLPTASRHTEPNPGRSRKLLLHRREIDKFIGMIERQGYTLIPLSLYWKKNRVKVAIGLARGKKTHDKRATIKERDWQRSKAGLMKKYR